MNKHQIILLISILSFVHVGLYGQNGKVFERKEFKAPQKVIQELNEDEPGANYTDTFNTVKMEKITYESNKLKVKGFILTPNKPGKYPCIIYNRDGYGPFGVLTETQVTKELHKMARWGYVVVASQYRGYDEGEGKDELGGEDVWDVLNLVPMLANESKADTSRIGVYGLNRGGMMTYLTMRETDQFEALISESGISNMFLYAAIHSEDGFYQAMEKMMPHYYADKNGAIKKRSISYWVDDIVSTTPLLIIHGSSDWEVHPDESQGLSELLFRKRYPHRFILMEGGSNGIPEFSDEKDLYIKLWFNRYVRDKEKHPEVINLERR